MASGAKALKTASPLKGGQKKEEEMYLLDPNSNLESSNSNDGDRIMKDDENENGIDEGDDCNDRGVCGVAGVTRSDVVTLVVLIIITFISFVAFALMGPFFPNEVSSPCVCVSVCVRVSVCACLLIEIENISVAARELWSNGRADKT